MDPQVDKLVGGNNNRSSGCSHGCGGNSNSDRGGRTVNVNRNRRSGGSNSSNSSRGNSDSNM